jgi:hypothetical protein
MSLAEVKRFNDDLKAKPALLDALKGEATDLPSIIAFAVSRGYEIKLEDVRAAVRATKADLSDEAIDKIVGGVVPLLTLIPIPLADAQEGIVQAHSLSSIIVFTSVT